MSGPELSSSDPSLITIFSMQCITVSMFSKLGNLKFLQGIVLLSLLVQDTTVGAWDTK